jgi:uncharacterized membrane protein YidH (DUF202 family)
MVERMGLRTITRRLLGALLVLVGLGLAKWQIWDPLHARELGREEVWIHSELLGLAILLPVLGSIYLTFGERVERWLRSPWMTVDAKQLTWRKTTVIMAIGLVLGAVYVWVDLQLAAQGYR